MIVHDITTVITLRKYKGLTLFEVSKINPSYIDYCLKYVSTFAVSLKAIKYLKNTVPSFRISKKAFAINIKKLEIHKTDEFGRLVIKRDIKTKTRMYTDVDL